MDAGPTATKRKKGQAKPKTPKAPKNAVAAAVAEAAEAPSKQAKVEGLSDEDAIGDVED